MFVMETHHVTCPHIRLEGPNTQSSNFVFNDLACNQMFIYQCTTLKTTRPGHQLRRIEFLAYQPDQNLCVVTRLQTYIDRTSSLRGFAEQLLIGYQKPYKPVSTNAISRWIKTVLTNAGIDPGVYKTHSTRATHKKQVPIDTILSAAGWSNMNTSQFCSSPSQTMLKILVKNFWKMGMTFDC